MKNFSPILAFILTLIFFSCSKAPEKKIEKIFSQYVEKNFDNPSIIDGIVSIDYVDTHSTKEIKKTLSEMKEIRDSLKAVRDAYDSSSILKKLPKGFTKDEVLRYAFQDHYDAMQELVSLDTDVIYAVLYLDSDISEVETFSEKYKKTQSLPDTTIIEHEISYRIKTETGKQLQKKYALCSQDYSKIKISNTKATIDLFWDEDSWDMVNSVRERLTKECELLTRINRDLEVLKNAANAQ